MFDIGSTELLMVAVVALVVIGPKDLPKAMRVVGRWVGKARTMVHQLRIGFDDIVRESEIADLEKKWADENARIMRDFPTAGDDYAMTPLPARRAAQDGDNPDADPSAERARDEPLLPGIADGARDDEQGPDDGTVAGGPPR